MIFASQNDETSRAGLVIESRRGETQKPYSNTASLENHLEILAHALLKGGFCGLAVWIMLSAATVLVGGCA